MGEPIPASQVVEEISKLLDRKLEPINNRMDKLEKFNEPKVERMQGNFVISDYGPGTTAIDVECPTCKHHEAVPKTIREVVTERVVEKPVEVVKEVEKVPEGYIKGPEDWKDIQPILEMKHADGKTVWDCPNCSKGFQTLAESHGYKKVK